MARQYSPRPYLLSLFVIGALGLGAGQTRAQEDASADDPDSEEAEEEETSGDDGGFSFTRGAHANSMFGQIGVRRVINARPMGHLRTSVSFWSGGTYYADFIGPADDETFLVRGGGVAAIGLFDILEVSGATDGGFIQSRFRDDNNDPTSLGASGAAFTAGLKLNPLGALSLFDLPSPVHVSISALARIPTRLGGSMPDIQNAGLTGRLNLSVDLTDSFGLPFRLHVNGGYRAQLAHYVLDTGVDANGNVVDQDAAAKYSSYFLRGQQQSMLAVAAEHWFYDQAFGGAALELPLPFVTPFIEAFWQTGINVPARYGADNGPAYDFLLNPITTISPGVRLHPVPGFNVTLFADIGATGTGGYLTPDPLELVNGQPLQPLIFAGVSAGGSFDVWPFGDNDSVSGGAAARTARICARDEADVPVAGAEVLIDDVAYATRADGCTTVYVIGDEPAKVRVSKSGMGASEVEVSAESGVSQVVLASATANRLPSATPKPASDETPPTMGDDKKVADGDGTVAERGEEKRKSDPNGAAAVPVAGDTKGGDTKDGDTKGKDGIKDQDAPAAKDGKNTSPGAAATDNDAARQSDDAEGKTKGAASVTAGKPGTIKGQVRASGKAVSRGTVTLTAIDGGEVKTVKVRRGKFTAKLAPGKYALTTGAPRHLRSGTVVDVTADKSIDVKIKLKKAPRRRLAKAKKTTITVTTPIAFAPNTAELLPAAEFVIADVADVLLSRKGSPVLKIEGSAPITSEKLARDRAAAVSQALQARGIPPARVKTAFKVAAKGAAPTLKLLLVAAE